MGDFQRRVADVLRGPDPEVDRLRAEIARLTAENTRLLERIAIVRKHAAGQCLHDEMRPDECLDAILEAIDCADAPTMVPRGAPHKSESTETTNTKERG